MSFLIPSFLFLASLASIPLIIHLIQRIKLKRVQYSSLFFITETKRETFSWLQLKEILLLIFRTLFIFFLFFSLARPYIRKKILLSNYEAARVIVLDDSYSMAYNNNFIEAKTRSKKLLSELKKGSEAAILTASPYIKTNLTNDLKSLHCILDTVRVSYSSNTLEHALDDAINILVNSNVPRKEIFIITDLQRRAVFPLVSKIGSHPNRISINIDRIGQKNKLKLSDITIVDVGKKNPGNVGVIEIYLSPNLPSQDFPSKPRVKVKNYSTKSVTRNLAFTLKFSERESIIEVRLPQISEHSGSQTSIIEVSLGPGETKTIPLDLEIQRPGVYKAEASLSFDSLVFDDTRYFTITVPEQIPILLLHENPSDIRYIEKALKLSFFSVTTANIKTLREQNLKRYKAVGLFSSSGLTYTDWGRLGYYLLARTERTGAIRKGGGLFIALDKEVKESQWSNALGLVSSFTGKQVTLKTPGFMTIEQVNYENPIMEIFKGIDISTSKFYSYWELNSFPETQILAYFSTHKPFLVEDKEKKVLIALTSFSIENTDFMFKATFLPLMHRLFTYLAFPVFSHEYRVDDTIFTQVETSNPVKIVTPKGEFVQMPAVEQGKLTVRLTDTRYPGFYQIGKDNFAVNVLAEEGDLTRISGDEIKNQNIKILTNIGGKITDLTKISLSLSILFFILELILLVL